MRSITVMNNMRAVSFVALVLLLQSYSVVAFLAEATSASRQSFAGFCSANISCCLLRSRGGCNFVRLMLIVTTRRKKK